MVGRLNVFGRTLLVVLTAWALFVIVPDLYRVFGDLGTLGFSADNDGRIYSVTDAPATNVQVLGIAEPGLEQGDRIDLARSHCPPIGAPACRGILAVFGGMGGMQYVLPGERVQLYVAPDRGGHAYPSRPITLVAEPDPLSLADRMALAAAEIVGIIVILKAFRLVWDRPCWMTWGFFLYMMWFNPGQYFELYANLQRWPHALLAQEGAQAIAQGAGYAGFVLFASRFPKDAVEPRWRNIERSLPLLAGMLIGLQLWSFANAGPRATRRLSLA